MRFGSLFSGIGGMDLGLERAGMTCAWQVEIDPFCRRVLARHWPEVRRYDDVRKFPSFPFEACRVDVIAGGFPCQDVSRIGKREGINGTRSGLVNDMVRIIRQLRPRYAIVENTPGWLDGGFGHVLDCLARIGFDAEWACLSVAALGAPHLRERVILVAYPMRDGPQGAEQDRAETGTVERGHRDDSRVGTMRVLRGIPLHDARGACSRLRVSPDRGLVHEPIRASTAWETESPVCRVAHGVPHRVDRLGGLGNAVVPAVAEWIGRRIMAHATQQDQEDARCSDPRSGR